MGKIIESILYHHDLHVKDSEKGLQQKDAQYFDGFQVKAVKEAQISVEESPVSLHLGTTEQNIRETVVRPNHNVEQRIQQQYSKVC